MCVCVNECVCVCACARVCACIDCGQGEDREITGGAIEDVQYVLHPHTARSKTESLA